MTHPNFQTNGASLEDCHTNFFALTELSGIKWRRLTCPGSPQGGGGGGAEPLSDPVLRSFARCLAADILCVWRRAPSPAGCPGGGGGGGSALDHLGAGPSQHHPHPQHHHHHGGGVAVGGVAGGGGGAGSAAPLSLRAAKELWVFWYGEEPDLAELVAPELNVHDSEQGSWESGLSYECRSLLFKALHNLIERCLLARGFVRLGRWFVQPHRDPGGASARGPSGIPQPPRRPAHLSFSFAFFVHGESSVCASVDVRRHPAIRRLQRAHVQQAQAATGGLKVILAPFGLAGALTGQNFKQPEANARLLDEWSHFYPLDKGSGLTDSGVVEVVVGGTKMRYPSCYVFVTDLDEAANRAAMDFPRSPAASSAATPVAATPAGGAPPASPPLPATPPPSPVSSQQQGAAAEVGAAAAGGGAAGGAPAAAPANGGARGGAAHLPERAWQQCVANHRPAPHQQRQKEGGAKMEFTGEWPFVEPTRRVQCACSKCRRYVGPPAHHKHASGPQGSSGPSPRAAGRGRIPFHRRPTSREAEPNASAAANRENKESQAAPAASVNSQADSRCPANPPAANAYTPQGGPPSYAPRTTESVGAPPSVGSPASAAPSPLPQAASRPPSAPPGDQPMPTLSPAAQAPPASAPGAAEKTPAQAAAGASPAPQPPGSPEKKEAAAAQAGGRESLKRPALAGREYEVALGEEEQTLDMLYDYSTMDAWLNHPVKKFKPDGRENRLNNRKLDLYTLYEQNNTHLQFDPSKCVIKPEVKIENAASADADNGTNTTAVHPHGVKRPGDPYEFEEEGGGPNCNMDGFKRGPGAVKEEVKKAENLFTSEGLQPSYKDLDQIFDNSDYTSSDEALQIQTPPGSTSLNHHEERDGKRLSGNSLGGCPTVGALRPEELSKMFPTPPSLEHNPMPSPCGQLDLPPPDFTDLGIVKVKQEIYPNMGSPQEENIEDWSFVFKPPIMCKMVGSSKYAPLTNLPSQNQPPIPPNCVYKPSWLQHIENKQQGGSSHQNSGPERGNTHMNPVKIEGGTSMVPNAPQTMHHPSPAPPSVRSATPLGSAFPPSPASAAFRPPPPPYELPSPATSLASPAAAYICRPGPVSSTLPAVAGQGMGRAVPEASSLTLNVLLTDTAFHVFRDHNFDSCTLCVCNAGGQVVGNIRGADAATYLWAVGDRTTQLLAERPPPGSSPYPGLPAPPPYQSGVMSPPPQSHHRGDADEDPIRCSCGFSAVVNRRLAPGCGLFYEDEQEITGMAEDPGERKKPPLGAVLASFGGVKQDPGVDREHLDVMPHSLIELVRDQLVFIPNTANSLVKAAASVRTNKIECNNIDVHVLEYSDSNEVTTVALEQSRTTIDHLSMCKVESEKQSKASSAANVHRWPFLVAPGPACNQDIVRVMRSLQPLLQEAIQKKCQTRLWEAPSAVKGPLTWRQFHRLAGRGTDDRCEPQPIPSLIVGHDKDWLSLSPYALQHWETLLLEPYSYSRDVAYIVVAPDNEAVLPKVKTFFRELSTAYELCKLGRHSPITKVLRDGILRVGRAAKMKIGNEPVEEWFTLLGDGETSEMLRLYAQVCKHHLAPHLQQVPMDRTLLDPPGADGGERSAPSPMPPPSTPDGGQSGGGGGVPDKSPLTPKSDNDGDGMKDPSLSSSGISDNAHDDDDREAPSVVIYLVEPFTLGNDQPELQRLACLALLRCFQGVQAALPENIRSNVSVQIISLESIVELNRARDRLRHSDHMRSLALNIFSQCRRLLVHTNNVKSLTGFGTAAMTDFFLKNKDEKNRAPYRLFTPPYILAPMREKADTAENFGKGTKDQTSVLYLSYCLSEDQSWLLAVATDERGEIFETITINIDIPNRSRRKKASARRVGLEKLMNFILGVMSQSVRPWRLVVGRLGRIGHGELKGWSWLLSKKNLLKASRQLKELCEQCAMMYPAGVPCVLSACLVSLEPDSVLRLMPDQFTPDERFSAASVNSQLSTPQDVSCTHILVFPTSATTQSSQTAFQEQHISADLGDEEFFKELDPDMADGMDGMPDCLNDIFNDWSGIVQGGGQSPAGSPRRDHDGGGSPGGAPGGPHDGTAGNPGGGGVGANPHDHAEEVGVVLQQPLALGYLVSTAPTGRMPRWFWAGCPHLEGACPAFLKNALHLHSPAVHAAADDLLAAPTAAAAAAQPPPAQHPLDSHYTTDVLRYVLEGYNALSWLALDSNTRDRLSCLPVHMQVLAQLYHAAAALL